MKKLFLIWVVIFGMTTTAYAGKFHTLLDFRAVFEMQTHGGLGNFTRFDNGGFTLGTSFRLSGLYSITPKIAVGAGIGIDGYAFFETGSIPVFLVAHYSPIEKIPQLYFFGAAGYSVLTDDDVENGWTADCGVGYKLMFRKHFGLNFHVGYNWKQFSGKSYWITDVYPPIEIIQPYVQHEHSLTVGVGFVF